MGKGQDRQTWARQRPVPRGEQRGLRMRWTLRLAAGQAAVSLPFSPSALPWPPDELLSLKIK